jgi:hypothetical protein
MDSLKSDTITVIVNASDCPRDGCRVLILAKFWTASVVVSVKHGNMVQVDWPSYIASSFSLTNDQDWRQSWQDRDPKNGPHYHVWNSSVQSQSIVQSRVHSPAFVVSHRTQQFQRKSYIFFNLYMTLNTWYCLWNDWWLVKWDVVERTDRLTHTATTVTLAAHAHRGLISHHEVILTTFCEGHWSIL